MNFLKLRLTLGWGYDQQREREQIMFVTRQYLFWPFYCCEMARNYTACLLINFEIGNARGKVGASPKLSGC